MNYKKTAGLIASLGLAIALTACGTSKAPAESSQSAAEVESVSVAEDQQAPAKEQALTIYASTDSIYDFVSMIGEGRVQVIDLMEGEGDAHHWEPTPQLLSGLNSADLFLVSGAGLESWLPDVQEQLTGGVKVVDMSAGVELKASTGEEEHEHEHEEEAHESGEEAHEEHEHEHEHGATDPHYWLSPKAASIQAKNVFDALVAADPEGKSVYEANYAKVQDKFKTLIADYETRLKPYEGKSVIVPHEAFAYMFDEAHLQQVGIEGMLAEGQPDAQRVSQIVDLAKKDGIKTVFYEGYDDPKEAEAIAQEIGAATAPLYTLEAESKEDRAKGENYFTFMEKNLDAIIQSFGGK